MDKQIKDRERIFQKLSVVNENIGHYRDKIETYVKYLVLIYSGVFSFFMLKFYEVIEISFKIDEMGLENALKQSEINYYVLSFILLMCMYLSTYCMWAIMTSSVHLKKLIDTSREVENLLGNSSEFRKIDDKIYTKYLYPEKLGKIYNVFFNHKIPFSELFLTSEIATSFIILVNIIIIPFSARLWWISTFISGDPLIWRYLGIGLFCVLFLAQFLFWKLLGYTKGITYGKNKIRFN